MGIVEDLHEKLKIMELPQQKTTRDKIFALAPELIAKNQAGMSWPEIHAWLNANGFEIKFSTLQGNIAKYRDAQRKQAELLDKGKESTESEQGQNWPDPTKVKGRAEVRRTWAEITVSLPDEYKGMTLNELKIQRKEANNEGRELPSIVLGALHWGENAQATLTPRPKKKTKTKAKGADASLQKEESATSVEPSDESATATE